jgi:molecular chaperone DnaK (HSP70)
MENTTFENYQNTDITSLNNLLCVGIDFGTTNSCISIWYKNKSIIITDIDGSETISTVIEINMDKKIIGKEAYLRKDIFDKTNNELNYKNTFLIYEIKKLLGKKFSDLTKEELSMIAYNIQSDTDDNIIIFDSNNNKSYYAEEIAIHIFMSFKVKTEQFLSKKFNTEIKISNSIISVPAYFNKNQRQIIKNSAENAGFNVIRLVNEPTAAAICYGLGKHNDYTNSLGINIIVFDFGGGTLDVSLLNINNGVYEVLASCGNNNLGGSDFDKKIMEYCINEFINLHNIDYEQFINQVQENSLQKLKYLCEQSKISLTDNQVTKIIIKNFYNSLDLIINFDREHFNTVTQDLIRLIIKPIQDVLETCELDKSQINEIIMVGGMTRVPLVRYNIERFFNKDVNCSIDPDTVVSIGAAIYGHMILNKESIQDKLLLIDRTSLSIGLETSGGIMDSLITRGTIIPIKKVKKYTTDTDFVDSIDIKIYEGERKFTKDNFLIGNFTLSGIEKQKRGIPEIQITFEIDTDGIIKIKAEDLNNPLNKKTIQVSGNKQNLSNEQIEQIIINAKQMDEIDKIDRIKKESYLSLIDSSKKIIENISEDSIQIPQDIKNEIIQNVQDILSWLQDTTYDTIDINKYKELLHDYKLNYTIYMIQQNTPIINLESANKEDEKGVEICEDNNTNIYSEQIQYFRQIIDEYDDIKKKILFIKHTDLSDKTNSDEILQNINILINDIEILYQYANDYLIKFVIDSELNDDIVQEYTNNLYELDLNFKEKFANFNDEFNIINKLINKLKEKENLLLDKLEKIQSSNTDYECSDEYIKINSNLDIIIEFESIIYKTNSGYSKINNDKIVNMINLLDNIN